MDARQARRDIRRAVVLDELAEGEVGLDLAWHDVEEGSRQDIHPLDVRDGVCEGTVSRVRGWGWRPRSAPCDHAKAFSRRMSASIETLLRKPWSVASVRNASLETDKGRRSASSEEALIAFSPALTLLVNNALAPGYERQVLGGRDLGHVEEDLPDSRAKWWAAPGLREGAVSSGRGPAEGGSSSPHERRRQRGCRRSGCRDEVVGGWRRSDRPSSGTSQPACGT